MDKNIKVSIVVAIYKSEKFLDKLLSSIINQTYKNLEIILVDDGSPDNSGKICDEYAEKDDRIIVVHKVNGGTCEARNIGLEKSTGEYLMIIDGDDWLEPDYVEYLLNIAVSTNSEMAMSLNIFTTRDRKQISSDKIEVYSKEKAVLSIIYPIMAIGPWNKIYKLSMIRAHNLKFDVPWSGEGLYFTSMAAAYSNHVGVGRKKVYNYRLNNVNSGLTHYNVQMGINALWNIKNIKHKLPIKTRKIKAAVNWHIWKNYNFLLRLILATNSQKKYWKEYFVCLMMVRLKIPIVLLTSEFPLNVKKQFLYRSIFPVKCAKMLTQSQKEDLSKDKMK